MFGLAAAHVSMLLDVVSFLSSYFVFFFIIACFLSDSGKTVHVAHFSYDTGWNMIHGLHML
jgi:hypothetical protein